MHILFIRNLDIFIFIFYSFKISCQLLIKLELSDLQIRNFSSDFWIWDAMATAWVYDRQFSYKSLQSIFNPFPLPPPWIPPSPTYPCSCSNKSPVSLINCSCYTFDYSAVFNLSLVYPPNFSIHPLDIPPSPNFRMNLPGNILPSSSPYWVSLQ